MSMTTPILWLFVSRSADRALSGIGWRGIVLSLGERLKPIRNFLEPFFARSLRHPGIHVGVFMRLARDRRFKVLT